MESVLLAKELETTCRVNGVWPQGRSKEFYPFYKMIQFYLDVIDSGLSDYELNISS
jgi:hypothetical protein